MSLPWFSRHGDHPISSSLFSVGSSLQLGVGLYGSVSCDLPQDVVRDALVLSVGQRNFGGVSKDNFARGEPPVHNWPLISVGPPSGSEDLVALLQLISLFFKIPMSLFFLRTCGMVRM